MTPRGIDPGVWFQLLGPVAVFDDGCAVDGVVRPQQHVVLAALLVDAARLVPAAQLVERVWGADPPPCARRTLQTHITRIRRMMAGPCAGRYPGNGPGTDPGDSPGTGPEPARLRYRTGGYLLEVDPDQVDLHRFRQLVDRSRDRDCPAERRAALLDRALRLWHGEPLAGLPGQWVERMRYGWRQQWLNAVVAWAEVQLQLGNTATVVDRLAGLVGEYPLVEPLTAMLMRALCAVGRPAEAMLHYISIRQRLVEQLGTDPTHSLRELYQDILQGS